ncbi:cyclic nucleotide-binding domain-containing protein [Azospira restricta]|uniref:Cyclic nucleotide-binding domain-containing protein n=1 Tax=Azospira restricta TaxID=404405 RepID=A0A974SMW1_9RHOO|nr:cyclic nucleotide-binding domain-containing protein [Azospira restricta]QRJ62842.1 cyclic nucleotide-binding domain-containing protein [Azospira restricta]
MAHWIKEQFSFQDLQRIMFRLIDRVRVFHGMSGEELLQLLESAEKCTFGGGETIVREGSTGAWLYVIIDGRVSVQKSAGGLPTELAELQAGDSFGEMSLVDQEARSATVIAETPCVLLRLSEKACQKHPGGSAKIYRNIACVLSRRLRDMDDAYVLCQRRAD